MQPPVEPCRNQFTPAQITALIRDSPTLRVDCGLELINPNLTVNRDLSDQFLGGVITRDSYADLHGSATLQLSQDLDWGQAIVRPYMILMSDITTARFNLGAYYVATPSVAVEQQPRVIDVVGYDILTVLADPVGSTYSVAAGTSYCTAIAAIFTSLNIPTSAFLIDQSSAASVLPSDKVWIVDPEVKWITVVNDLISAIGYRGVYSDWNGMLRVEKYISPVNRAPEWVYDMGSQTSMMDTLRTVQRDLFAAPNRWVAVRQNNTDGVTPVEGNGIYTYVNLINGAGSVQARGGRQITKVINLDAADQASLVATAQITIDADTTVPTKITLNTSPNPLHWHFDRFQLFDQGIISGGQGMTTKWSLPLDGSDMSQEWTLL